MLALAVNAEELLRIAIVSRMIMLAALVQVGWPQHELVLCPKRWHLKQCRGFGIYTRTEHRMKPALLWWGREQSNVRMICEDDMILSLLMYYLYKALLAGRLRILTYVFLKHFCLLLHSHSGVLGPLIKVARRERTGKAAGNKVGHPQHRKNSRRRNPEHHEDNP